MFRVLDLFCGPGGLSFGFRMARFLIAAGVDVDPWSCETYRFNFPGSTVLQADLEKLEANHDDLPKDIDVIIGGPPCQGFSPVGRVKIASLAKNSVGKLKDRVPRFIDDPRNVLYKEFVRMVDAHRPAFFVMENVPGLLSYHDGRIAELIRQDFEDIGYHTRAALLNAAEFGTPQVRRRVFFIGNRLGLSNPLPIATHRQNTGTPMFDVDLKPYVTVWEAIGDLAGLESGGGAEEQPYPDPAESEYQRWARQGSEILFNHRARRHTERDLKIFDMLKDGVCYKDLPDEYKPYRDDIFHDRLKRLDPAKPSWTVMAHLEKDGYMYIHPTRNRTITVREAARLQGFPDTFRFMGSRTQQFRQVGTAVPLLLARAVAVEIGKALENAASRCHSA